MNIEDLQPILIMLGEQENRLVKKIDDQESRVFKKLDDLHKVNCDTNAEVRKINGRLREAEKDIVSIKHDVKSGKERCDRNSVASDFIKILFYVAKRPKMFMATVIMALVGIQILVVYVIEYNILGRIIELIINRLLT